MSHPGGTLPYQAGRRDKNTKAVNLVKPTSDYIRNMYTDTVTPHSAGMRFTIDFYSIDNVMYGTDYPCWQRAECLGYIAELNLSPEDQCKLFFDNAVRILNPPVDLGAWRQTKRVATE
jgi:aminocarboxymuconate-semialdehyde decarboxylase